jgi:hypothetical protein
MHRKMIAILGTAATTATLLGLGSTAAMATTYTVSPAGAVTATQSGNSTLKDVSTGNTLTCTAGSGKATLSASSNGSPIGTISALTYSGCTGPLSLSFTVTANSLPYDLNVTAYNSGTGVSTGTITGINAALSGPGCSATVKGTVDASYSNSTGNLTVSPDGSALTVTAASCLGIVATGNVVNYNAVYSISPKQKIT